jgi:hypothetical protein
MPRDLLGRPPLLASELPPTRVSLYPGEPRAIRCPGCGRWQRPHDGGLRRHTIDSDSRTLCPQSGRRVWFDLTPTQWRAELEAGVRETVRCGSWARRSRVHRSRSGVPAGDAEIAGLPSPS